MANILDDYLIDKSFKLNKEDIEKQIKTFNNFMKNKIPKNILGFKEIELTKNEKTRVNVYNYVFIKQYHKLEDGSFIIVTPEVARKHKLSYSLDVHIDMNIFNENKKFVKTANNIWLGSIPIMIGSNECKLSSLIDKEDNGGYFIINGVEKILNNKKNEL
jgi:DNA-directed RNA polymerase beta subunit